MKYGLIGEHLTHSYSCEIHAQIADYEYELHELRPDELGEFMTKREFNAINVTIPYKQDVIPYLDEISETAKRIGAVNTIVNRNGKLYGDNTDFPGMLALAKHAGVSISVSATSAPGHSSLIPGCHITPAGKTGPHLPSQTFAVTLIPSGKALFCAGGMLCEVLPPPQARSGGPP